jgi:hypothetical protein
VITTHLNSWVESPSHQVTRVTGMVGLQFFPFFFQHP